ncbi:hypothetical protein [Solemya velesiana gill symbiont]|uniref:Uncharacterized protein n=1 Tax=Solemya velesiana gill symbiont TaxID=1918948 RepID=A0A1T2KV27_9GAMM|nr:hypothetical protein [Solemya velesiana gill symbiont]OOZ36695.1 hypothetical protein BOW51_05970 [Solemya velesiana gill symbiont]
MSFKTTLSPSQSRSIPGERWLNVLFRTMHLVGMAGLGAGFLYAAADELWRIYLHITLVSCVGLVLLSICSNGIWLIQLRGQAILFKLVLLILVLWLPDWKAHLFILVVVISGWISHAPASVRYYSLYHRRRIEKL